MIKVTLANRVRYAVVQFGSYYMYTAGCFPYENTKAIHTYEYGMKPGNAVHNEHNDAPVTHSMCKGNLCYAGKFKSELVDGKRQVCYDYAGNVLINVGGSYWNGDTWPLSNAGKNSGSRGGYTFDLSLRVDGDTITATVKYTKVDYTCTVPLTEHTHKFYFPAGYGILQHSWKQPIYWPSGSLRKVDTLSITATLSIWHGFAAPDGVMLEGLAAFGREVFPARTFSDIATAVRNSYDELRTEAIIKSLKKLKELDINSLAYTRDLKEFNSSNRKLLKALKQLRKPKNWANVWLAYRYGIRLFILDSIEIGKAIKKAFCNPKATETFVRSKVETGSKGIYTGCDINLTSRSKIYLSTLNSAEMRIAPVIRRYDFMPSLVNIWDFVPYSFVIDWIIPIGDLFERLDAILDLNTFPVTGGVTSIKATTEQNYTSFHGSVKFSYYNRICETQMTLSRLSIFGGLQTLAGFSNSEKSLKHGVDTLALVAQRK